MFNLWGCGVMNTQGNMAVDAYINVVAPKTLDKSSHIRSLAGKNPAVPSFQKGLI